MPKLGKTPGIHPVRSKRKTGPDAWYATGSLLENRKVRLEGVTNRKAAEAECLKIYRQLGRKAVVTVGQALDLYEEDQLERERLGTIVTGTRRQNVKAARLVADVCGRQRPTADLTADDLWAVSRECSARAGKPSTAKLYLTLARSVLSTWRRQRLLTLSSDDIDDCLRLTEQVVFPPPVWFRQGQIASMLKLARDDPRPRLYLLLGLRVTELLSLRWEDGVDLDQRVIRVDHAGTTKWSRDVDLRIAPSAEAWLRDHWKRRGKVVAGKKSLQTTIRRIRKEHPGVKVKDFRSTCASYLHCAAGIPMSATVKARQLGHSITIAESRYVGTIRTIDPRATTLEQAMGLTPVGQRREAAGLPGDPVRPIDYERGRVK